MSFKTYWQRFGFCERQLGVPPHPDLGLAVVIPCFDEPDLIGSLESIWQCQRPGCAVEVIVVVNSAEGCAPEIREQNAETLATAEQWLSSHQDPELIFHFLNVPDLPRRHAGVGLARKIGMDEAASRLGDVGRSREGIIACFDADCRCDPNYLVSLQRHFENEPSTPGCSIYFEHPLEGRLPSSVYEAIVHYELHLRYYVQALRYADFPYAHHTVGSAMAVRAEVYQQQGGMNKRQAGEDFYFLQKIIPLGGFTDLNDTRVIPSPRPSERVPFGSGRAVRDFLADGRLPTYPLQAFLDLRTFFELATTATQADVLSRAEVQLSVPLRDFLRREHLTAAVQVIRSNTASLGAFRKRLLDWFNGFRIMKFIHHARDQFYGEGAVCSESASLLELLGLPPSPKRTGSARELLACYRGLQRLGHTPAKSRTRWDLSQ